MRAWRFVPGPVLPIAFFCCVFDARSLPNRFRSGTGHGGTGRAARFRLGVRDVEGPHFTPSASAYGLDHLDGIKRHGRGAEGLGRTR